MKGSTQKQNFWNYLTESARILYWAYLKPFTFARWLQDIQLRSRTTTDLSEQGFGFSSNQNPQHYTSQARLLSTAIPILVVLFVGLIYALTAHELFNWLYASLFLLGWWVGLWFVASPNRRQWRWIVLFILVVGSITFLILSKEIWLPGIMNTSNNSKLFNQVLSFSSVLVSITVGMIVGVIFGGAVDMVVGVAVGIAVGVVGGLAFSRLYGVIGGIEGGIAGGLAGGLAFGVARGLAGGPAKGLAVGLAVSLAVGFALSVSQSMAAGVKYGLGIGIAVGLGFGVAFGVAFSLTRMKVGNIAFSVVVDVLVGLLAGIAGGVAIAIAGTIVFGLAFGLAFGVAGTTTWMLGALRIYFWIPEFLWMLILYGISRQGEDARWLPYLPPHFDELIILPLPFMKDMIVRVHRDNPSAARQTINYLITSTNQQRAAAKAIMEIVLDVLNECRSTSEVSAIADNLAWIPSPPPRAIGTVLPQFLEVSQSVRAALESSSFYRRYRELEKPIDALVHLRDTLGLGGSTWDAITFGGIAERWIFILENARRNLGEQAQLSKEIPQEYIAGPALEPEKAGNRFKGRLDLFREIENLVYSPQPPVLLLYGDRRAGKTSVLKYLPRHLGPEVVPLLVNFHGVADAITLSGIAEGIANQIVKAAWESRKLHLPPVDSFMKSVDPFPSLRKWLSQIENVSKEKRFLLCLDEFARLDETIATTKNKAPLNFLRYIMQDLPQWIVLFSSSQTPDELPSYWSDYLINTRALRVSYLEEGDARELIMQPVEGFPPIYEREAVDTIIQITHCQPYLVQLICFLLVEDLNKEIRTTDRSIALRQITPQDVNSIIPRAFDEGVYYFKEFWDTTLLAEERKLLLSLVREGVPDEKEQFILQKLMKKEILEQVEGSYRFQVPLIQLFIESKITE